MNDKAPNLYIQFFVKSETDIVSIKSICSTCNITRIESEPLGGENFRMDTHFRTHSPSKSLIEGLPVDWFDMASGRVLYGNTFR